jgi:hypothetical protein
MPKNAKTKTKKNANNKIAKIKLNKKSKTIKAAIVKEKEHGTKIEHHNVEGWNKKEKNFG